MPLQQTNLLFVIFDDLRPELKVYGREHMITPNFDRLAKRSVIFDNAYTMIAVCNPARDALMTGLRPDTTGTYAFQTSFQPHITFPTQLTRSGYNTAGFGKVLHWEGNDRNIWSFDSWENDWYTYQNNERNFMNSSTMPDKTRREEDFRDYQFTTRAIDCLHRLLKEPKYFMLAVGFKNPHLAQHVPYKYYDMYRGKETSWHLNKKELRFPSSAPEVSYRCCAEPHFLFMNEHGAKKAKDTKFVNTPDNINHAYTEQMHDELMLGYCALISFVDAQLGRILDELDRLDLWRNMTVVLTADHGMHNGEKGIWEKWSLFDESTRVPLFIAHPQSPFGGEHYLGPVESVDVYATLQNLIGAKFDKNSYCHKGDVCHQLQGKSLAPIVVPEMRRKSENAKFLALPNAELVSLVKDSNDAGRFKNDFSISQNYRCAPKQKVAELRLAREKSKDAKREHIWFDCDRNSNNANEMSVMGYSMRTLDFRYTAWFHYNRAKAIPIVDVAPFEEELYDHRNETLADFTHRELVNLAHKPGFAKVARNHRDRLVQFIKQQVVFRGPFK